MDAVDQLRLRDDQNLGAVLQVVRMPRERLASELLLIKLVRIDERTHRSVKEHDPRRKNLLELLSCTLVPVRRHRLFRHQLCEDVTESDRR